MHQEQLSYDREEIEEAGRQIRQEHEVRAADLVLTLRAVQHRIGRWLHPVG